MKKILISLLLISVLMVPTTVLAQEDVEINPDKPADSSLENGINNNVVATVNGEEITAKELSQQSNINQIMQQVGQVDQQLAQILASSDAGKKVMKELQKKKLDSVIDNVLLKQQVEEKNITLSQSEKDEIYKQQKKRVLEQNQMSEKQFKNILKQQGYESEAAYKKEISSNPGIKINKLIEQEVTSDIEVSEKEMKNFYDKNKDRLSQSGKDTSYEDLKPRIKQMLKQQKQSKAINQYLEKLRKEADISKNI